MPVASNCVVSIRYTMKNGSGEVLENAMNNNPVNYLHGSPGIQPLLQAQLEGLRKGEKKTVYLLTGSGITSDDFIFEVVIDDVRPALQEEIILGYPVKINLVKCEVDCDCYS